MSDNAAPAQDRGFYIFNAVVSAAALAFLSWLLLLNQGTSTGFDVAFLPKVNAGLNATAAVLLTVGWLAIRSGRRDVHRYLMVAAFAASSLFLVGYVTYHYAHGDTRFQGEGTIRLVYFAILISHVLLSIGIVPGALSAFYFAWRGRFRSHKRVTRWLLPAWIYVSITGVVIYFMLHG